MAASDTLRQCYAPTGTLRVALNFGNRVLVGRDEQGHATGISVDIARALAAELGLTPRFVEFDRAIDVSSSAPSDRWDVCFLAVDPKRGETIRFTAPYVRIAGHYLIGPARAASTRTRHDVLDLGLTIAVAEGSAYALHLLRQPGADHVRPVADIHAALAALDRGEVDGVAGIRQVMEAEGRLRPGSALLDPPFMEIRQAMGVPIDRQAAADHLRGFLATRAQDGTIGTIVARHGVSRDCVMLPADAETPAST